MLDSGSGSGSEFGFETTTTTTTVNRSERVTCVAGDMYGVKYPLLSAWGDEADECEMFAHQLNELIGTCSGRNGTLYCVDLTSTTTATSTATTTPLSFSGSGGAESEEDASGLADMHPAFRPYAPPTEPPFYTASTHPAAGKSTSSGSGDEPIITDTTTQTSTATSTPTEYGLIVLAGSKADAATLDGIIRASLAAVPGGYTPLTTNQDGYLSHTRLSFRFGRDCYTHGCRSIGTILNTVRNVAGDRKCGLAGDRSGPGVVVAQDLGPDPSCVRYPALECVGATGELLYAVGDSEQCEKVATLLIGLMGVCEPSPPEIPFVCSAVGNGKHLLKLAAAATCDLVVEQLAAGVHASGQPWVDFQCNQGYLAFDSGSECAAKHFLELALAEAADVAAGKLVSTASFEGSTCVCEEKSATFYMDFRDVEDDTLSSAAFTRAVAAAIEQKLRSVLSIAAGQLAVDRVDVTSGAVTVTLRPAYPRGGMKTTCGDLVSKLGAVVNGVFSVDVNGESYTTWSRTEDDHQPSFILILFLVFAVVGTLVAMYKKSLQKEEAKKPRLSTYFSESSVTSRFDRDADWDDAASPDHFGDRAPTPPQTLSNRYSRFGEPPTGSDNLVLQGMNPVSQESVDDQDAPDYRQLSEGFFGNAVERFRRNRFGGPPTVPYAASFSKRDRNPPSPDSDSYDPDDALAEKWDNVLTNVLSSLPESKVLDSDTSSRMPRQSSDMVARRDSTSLYPDANDPNAPYVSPRISPTFAAEVDVHAPKQVRKSQVLFDDFADIAGGAAVSKPKAESPSQLSQSSWSVSFERRSSMWNNLDL